MNGCSYIDRETGQPVTWSANYNSQVLQWLLSRGRNIILIEEPYYKHKQRDINWLIEKGYMK